MQTITHSYDFVVIGAGMAGIGAAVTAARGGLKTALITDRPCLGGNASKEMQTPPIGAHYVDGNYAYHRETGLLEELLLGNLNNNPQGNVELWDLNLQTLIRHEEKLDLYLNLVIQEVQSAADGTAICSVSGYSLESDNRHVFEAPLFADCSGNGVVGYEAGAPFMRGVEGRGEFNESLAPETAEKREMGCSLRFRAKDVGHAVTFTKPDWVKYSFTAKDFEKRGIEIAFCNSHGGFWWLEWGGALDTISGMDTIRQELNSVLFAIWHYLKNDSPIRDEIACYDLDWVGAIPGRRENRRFIGDYILTQTDIDEQRSYEDSVAFGGWGFDDHPADGLFEEKRASSHVFHAGPYNIPLRCLYSRQVRNLFFAGRNISVSHMALTSTRVMCTCFQLGDAVGAAAVICRKNNILPRTAAQKPYIRRIQEYLNLFDHTIYDHPPDTPRDIAGKAAITASSTLSASALRQSSGVWPLTARYAVMFPISAGRLDSLKLIFDVTSDTTLKYEIRAGYKHLTNIPGPILTSGSVRLQAGKDVVAQIPAGLSELAATWHFVVLEANDSLAIHYGVQAPTGLKTLVAHSRGNEENRELYVEKANNQWDIIKDLETEPSCLIELLPRQPVYQPENVLNPVARPTFTPNLWISQESDFSTPEQLELTFDEPVEIESIQLLFDSSLDNSISAFCSDCNCMLNGYAFHRVPSVVKSYRLYVQVCHAREWQLAAEETDNYQRLRTHEVRRKNIVGLRLEILGTNGWKRAQIYGLRVLRKEDETCSSI